MDADRIVGERLSRNRGQPAVDEVLVSTEFCRECGLGETSRTTPIVGTSSWLALVAEVSISFPDGVVDLDRS